MSAIESRLFQLQTVGIKLGLENIRTLLKFLNHPEKAFSSILIAGTNGKGSVAAMMEEILLLNGCRTGLYISPHLVTVRERIRVAGAMISPADFEGVLAQVFSAIDELMATGGLHYAPTYFETLTAAAMLHFRSAGIEWAVVEVGLGGRYDATNAIEQKLSIITSIDYDHQEYLGQSLQEIAAEKAAICKHRVPLVTGFIPEEAIPPIRQTASQYECDWNALGPEDIEDLTLLNGFPRFRYRPWNSTVSVNLRGKHQAGNAAIALAACSQLMRARLAIQRDAVMEALNKVQWPGRLQVLSNDPPVILDCAHNPGGVQTLVDFIHDMKWNRIIAVFTAMKDKNIQAMLARISPLVEEFYLTRVEPFERCATEEHLLQAASFLGKPHHFHGNAEYALRAARSRCTRLGLPLIIFGSIYLAGNVLASNTAGHGL